MPFLEFATSSWMNLTVDAPWQTCIKVFTLGKQRNVPDFTPGRHLSNGSVNCLGELFEHANLVDPSVYIAQNQALGKPRTLSEMGTNLGLQIASRTRHTIDFFL